ncbi:hypothetical protein F4780DRAFT_794261 [Xylariomycetidae sp. FL0641]|nr:hypothetical protein F4780DRAFT_794261 [Xylariomycetidae sp. FL0641]
MPAIAGSFLYQAHILLQTEIVASAAASEINEEEDEITKLPPNCVIRLWRFLGTAQDGLPSYLEHLPRCRTHRTLLSKHQPQPGPEAQERQPINPSRKTQKILGSKRDTYQTSIEITVVAPSGVGEFTRPAGHGDLGREDMLPRSPGTHTSIPGACGLACRDKLHMPPGGNVGFLEACLAAANSSTMSQQGIFDLFLPGALSLGIFRSYEIDRRSVFIGGLPYHVENMEEILRAAATQIGDRFFSNHSKHLFPSSQGPQEGVDNEDEEDNSTDIDEKAGADPGPSKHSLATGSKGRPIKKRKTAKSDQAAEEEDGGNISVDIGDRDEGEYQQIGLIDLAALAPPFVWGGLHSTVGS